MYACMPVCTRTSTSVRRYVYVCVIHVCINAGIYKLCMRAHICIHIYTCIYIYSHIYIYICTCTHTCTYIHTYIHVLHENKMQLYSCVCGVKTATNLKLVCIYKQANQLPVYVHPSTLTSVYIHPSKHINDTCTCTHKFKKIHVHVQTQI